MKLWQAGALVGAGLVAGAIAMRVAAPTAGDAAQKPAAAAEADAGEGLKIDEATAKAAALQTAALEPGQVGETRDGYARALDPQPLGTIAAEIAAARAAHDGSRRELDRLTGLVAADAGATQRDLDAARLPCRSARGLARSAAMRWSGWPIRRCMAGRRCCGSIFRMVRRLRARR